MASFRITLAACTLSVLLLGTAPTHAFGPDGHRIIAELAQRQLSEPTRADVARLLADDVDDELAGIANWADEIRDQPDWRRRSSAWHYVNFPRDTCRYDARRDCRDGRCIVDAISTHAAILADRRRSDAERAQALRFLVHFIGDVHQPLHAGHGDDRGGNTFQVFYIGRGSNLHALWDGGILRSARRSWLEQVDHLDSRAAGVDTRWSATAPMRWAEESCRLIVSSRLYPARPGTLPEGYVERQYPVLEQQLVIAAARLARALDTLLGDARSR